MGEELCRGCRDCTNNNQEEDFSHQANPPLTNINNPFFFNNKTSNSVNEVTQMNNESFLNNYNHNNKNESYATTNNIVDLEENSKLRSTNHLNSEESQKLREIKKNNCSRKITNLFRKYKELKNNSHQILCKEYSTIPSSEYILDLNNDELDVNLAPEVNCLYLGTKFQNKKDGLGLEVFADTKSKYFGIFRNGKRVDAGQFTINNDFQDYYYYGQVKGIYAWGFGWFQEYKNYTYYEGNWENSMKNGYGIEKYQDKSEYMGNFVNGKKDGIGYYKWLDGSSYEGEWKENKLHGYGIYTFKDGSIYKGEWKRNRMNGVGEFSYPGVKTYIGFFERDIRNGFGMLIWHKTNKAFVGFWKNNKQDGLGKFIVNDKKRYGIWKNGEIIEKIGNKNEFDKRLNNEEIGYSTYFQMEEYDNFSQFMI
jgi:hypothetical protein